MNFRFDRGVLHAQAYGTALYVQLGTWAWWIGRAARGLRIVLTPKKQKVTLVTFRNR